MSVAEELRARRGDPDDPFDQTAARRDYKRHATAKDRELNAAARAGQRAERERATRAPVAKRRRAARVPRQVRRATASIGGGVSYQLVRLFVITLGLVVLYLVLVNAGTLTGIFGLIQSAIKWVVSPTATIGGKA